MKQAFFFFFFFYSVLGIVGKTVTTFLSANCSLILSYLVLVHIRNGTKEVPMYGDFLVQ